MAFLLEDTRLALVTPAVRLDRARRRVDGHRRLLSVAFVLLDVIRDASVLGVRPHAGPSKCEGLRLPEAELIGLGVDLGHVLRVAADDDEVNRVLGIRGPPDREVAL